MSDSNNASNGLKKSFGTKEVFALAFGTMIGWGWIMLSGTWAANAGMVGAILAYVVGAILCIFIGVVYAELTPAIPCTGGGVVFSYKSMGYWPAVIAGLATSFAYIGVAAWEGPAFATAVDYVFPIPKAVYLWTVQGYDVYGSWAAVAIIASVIITYVNYKGAEQAAVFQKIASLGLIAVGVLFVFGGVTKGDVSYTKPYFTDVKGFASVLIMVPAMFVGFDIIPQSASEMDVPLKKIPKILVLSICAAAAWYIIMIFTTCISAPTSIRVNGVIPVADAMAFAFNGAIWGKICIIGAICGILTSWNGFMFGSARVLYSLANARMLPAFLGKIHPKYNSPSNAVLTCGLLSTFSCLLGKGALTWFVNASSFGVVIMYLMVALSFVFLRKNLPDLERPYKIKYGKIIGTLSMLVVVFFAWLYLPFGPSPLIGIEWTLVIGWFVLGTILAVYARFKYKDFSEADRVNALFGE